MASTITIAEQSYARIKSAEDYVYPELLPYREEYLSVSSIHFLWFAEYGNPHGVPALVVHGGPGGGCGPLDMRLFDPQIYRIILVDQRGAGRSRPVAETRENTTADLIADMERVREHLGIAKWLLVGGSWGSALALAYGEEHTDRVLGFILRGIFLATHDEYMKLWNTMGDFYPEVFHEFVSFLPESERSNLLASYHQRLIDPDPSIHLPAARAFYHYDMMCATLVDKSRVAVGMTNNERVLALSRLFAHYCMNRFFVTHDQLMNNVTKIHHLPLTIIHGRYDVICRASSAFRLHKAWPNSHLVIVPDAGHATSDPGIAREIVSATQKFQKALHA